MKRFKYLTILWGAVAFCLAGAAHPAFATGNLTYAIPDQIEIVRGQGFLIYGEFIGGATVLDCTADYAIWVSVNHPQYDLLYSTAMSAMLGGKKIRGYAHACTAIGWHGGTFNEINGAGALYIAR